MIRRTKRACRAISVLNRLRFCTAELIHRSFVSFVISTCTRRTDCRSCNEVNLSESKVVMSEEGLGSSSSSAAIDSSNIGFQLLNKHGWKEGTGLGVSEQVKGNSAAEEASVVVADSEGEDDEVDDDDDELDMDELNELEANLSKTSMQISDPDARAST